MIAYLEGRLAETWGNACLIVTEGGVGYEVALPAHTLAALPDRGEPLALYTSLAVREDALELFGFASFEERQTFEVLVSISKVGARTALAILSIFRPDDLRRLVLEDDVLALTRVSGIGKKTAQHVFLELKYKLKVEDVPQAAVLAAYYSQARSSTKVPVDYTPVKFVKKPAGARPGMVIYTTCQTLLADPDEELVKRLAGK